LNFLGLFVAKPISGQHERISPCQPDCILHSDDYLKMAVQAGLGVSVAGFGQINLVEIGTFSGQ